MSNVTYVTITQCYGEHVSLESKHWTDDPDTAVRRAIQKHYGKAASLFMNYELSTDDVAYGQIGKPARTGGSDMITGRVRIVTETAGS